MDKKLIGQRIRRYRIQKGWSQEELSYQANLSLGTIGRMERGEYTPTLPAISATEKALGIPESTLLTPSAPPGQKVLCLHEFEYDLKSAGIPSDASITIVLSIQMNENKGK